jgi:hypothetical protein
MNVIAYVRIDLPYTNGVDVIDNQYQTNMVRVVYNPQATKHRYRVEVQWGVSSFGNNPNLGWSLGCSHRKQSDALKCFEKTRRSWTDEMVAQREDHNELLREQFNIIAGETGMDREFRDMDWEWEKFLEEHELPVSVSFGLGNYEEEYTL